MTDSSGTAHAGAQLSLILDPDRQSMHFTISRDGKLLAGLVMNAEQLDNTMIGLGDVRSRMLPEVPTTLVPGTARDIKGTHYDFGVDERTGQLIFSVREPILGWLSFRFGAKLLERMLKIARSPQPASRTKQ